MDHPKHSTIRLLGKMLTVLLLVTVFAAGSFATLGDGKKKASTTPKNSLLSGRTVASKGFFSLKSGYSYKGNQVLNNGSDTKYINLNTVVTIQRGNNTYVVPLKKKAILDKVKIEIGNRQFKRN